MGYSRSCEVDPYSHCSSNCVHSRRYAQNSPSTSMTDGGRPWYKIKHKSITDTNSLQSEQWPSISGRITQWRVWNIDHTVKQSNLYILSHNLYNQDRSGYDIHKIQVHQNGIETDVALVTNDIDLPTRTTCSGQSIRPNSILDSLTDPTPPNNGIVVIPRPPSDDGSSSIRGASWDDWDSRRRRRPYDDGRWPLRFVITRWKTVRVDGYRWRVLAWSNGLCCNEQSTFMLPYSKSYSVIMVVESNIVNIKVSSSTFYRKHSMLILIVVSERSLLILFSW